MKNFNQSILFIFACLVILFRWTIATEVYAELTRSVERGPVHEAYLSPIKGSIILEAVSSQPPQLLIEKTPVQDDFLTIWIPGYWQWLPEQKSFLWISGIWRHPPPSPISKRILTGDQQANELSTNRTKGDPSLSTLIEHIPSDLSWIPGYWHYLNKNWVYISGFWSTDKEQELNYIPKPPPEPIQEEIITSPGIHFSWLPGYWIYSKDAEDYVWIPGKWLEMDPNWILVPAHYEWREKGYVYVPFYWDWPLEKRGQAYANLYIYDLNNIQEPIIYKPTIKRKPDTIVRNLIVDYPDYAYFYHHYYYFYYNRRRIDLSFIPPWWLWNHWWNFNWSNQWALWWWYTHPGYPQPYWINTAISREIPPPSSLLLDELKEEIPPSIVTPYGVVSSNALLNALVHIESSRIPTQQIAPIIPDNLELKAQILNQLKVQRMKPTEVLRPIGKIEKLSQIKPPIPDLKSIPSQLIQLVPQVRQELDKQLSPEQLQNLKQKIPLAKIPAKPTAEAFPHSQQ